MQSKSLTLEGRFRQRSKILLSGMFSHDMRKEMTSHSTYKLGQLCLEWGRLELQKEYQFKKYGDVGQHIRHKF